MEHDLRSMSNKYERIETAVIDVLHDPETLRKHIQNAQVVVSLLPYQLHPIIAKLCIETGVNMVTASYCTDEMMALHDRYTQFTYKLFFLLPSPSPKMTP